MCVPAAVQPLRPTVVRISVATQDPLTMRKLPFSISFDMVTF
ncbi:hypothetical protein CKAH01_09563 [Colletotrichum kahawae]|uniref:Uncharacterized protein n=1 Tax=Colletotrichum kahawae TaxID=34407 RepID=A0AAD9XZJ2_COLKA|nr:hypothetical protein CKAH01_09563 [Colletotrichum kahawae]